MNDLFRQALSLIVRQVVDLGRLRDGSRPVDILIGNALRYAVEGTVVYDGLQALLGTEVVEA